MPRRKPALDLISVADEFATKLERVQFAPNINRYEPMPKQSVFHQRQNRHRAVRGGNRAGKCLAEGTLVLMADGSQRAIEALRPGDMVIAVDGTPTRVTALHDQGVQMVRDYELGRFQDREIVTCTPEHKFWGAREPKRGKAWEYDAKSIGSLVDNRRARHKVMRSQGTRFGGVRQDGRAFTLGLLLGNGHIPAKARRQPSQIQFTTDDDRLIEEMHGMFVARGASGIQYGITKEERAEFGAWLDDLGLAGSRSRDKEIPAEVWNWDEASIAGVVAGLLVTDGSWWHSGNEWHATFCSRSRVLVEQMRTLMGIRLGIWGSKVASNERISSSFKDGTDYQISFGTREALERIAALPLRGRKRALALEAASAPRRNTKSSHVGVRERGPLRPMRCWDITVEHPTHMFMLANGLICSNTYSSTADDVQVLLRQHPYRQHLYEDRPLRMRFIGVDFERGIFGAALPLFSQFIPPSRLIGGSWDQSFQKSRMLLTLDDGSTCNFMSYEQDPDKFQAVWLDHIHMDEEPPIAIFNESRLRIIDKNGTMTISMTPVQQMEWLEDEIIVPALEGRLPGWSVDELDTRENIHLSSAALAELMGSMSAAEQLVRLTGGYLTSNKVFPEFVGSAPNVIDHDEFMRDLASDREWAIYESMDYGYRSPTAWVWTAVHPDGRLVSFKELYAPGVTVPEWCELVHQARVDIMHSIGREWEPVLTVGDPSIDRAGESAAAGSGLSIQQIYASGGINIGTEGLRKLRASNQNIGLEKIHMYLRRRVYRGVEQPWWQITDACPHGIDELRRARPPHKTLTQKERSNEVEQIRDKDNHWIDAVKYLFMMTHDLRPEEVLEDEVPSPLIPEVRTALGMRDREPMREIRTHDDAYYATVLSGNLPASEYYDLEY